MCDGQQYDCACLQHLMARLIQSHPVQGSHFQYIDPLLNISFVRN
jgi:hypothetical protein